MQRVLVAGGAGFIGSHLCEDLLQNGYEVICIDNLITGDKKNINNLLNSPHFQFIKADVTKPLSMQSANYIFHLASPASPNAKSNRSYIRYPIETLLVNSMGTYELLNTAMKNNAKFLFASSSEVYGDPSVSPQPEEYFGNVNPNGIRSVYDEAKRFGEAMTMAYVRKKNMDARVVRVFNTYGPKMQKDDGRVVSNFITQAIENKPITVYGEGLQTRSFCFIEDMVDGLKRAMFFDDSVKQVINLGNPDERTIKELATMIKELTGSSSEILFEPLPEDDPKKRKPDIAKAKRLLNWEPKVSLKEGLSRTIKYFKSI